MAIVKPDAYLVCCIASFRKMEHIPKLNLGPGPGLSQDKEKSSSSAGVLPVWKIQALREPGDLRPSLLALNMQLLQLALDVEVPTISDRTGPGVAASWKKCSVSRRLSQKHALCPEPQTKQT